MCCQGKKHLQMKCFFALFIKQKDLYIVIFKDRNPATQGGIFHFSSTIVSGVSPSSAFTMSVLNVDVTINNQTYKADISYGNAKVYINIADGSFILDFSENEGNTTNSGCQG